MIVYHRTMVLILMTRWHKLYGRDWVETELSSTNCLENSFDEDGLLKNSLGVKKVPN